VNGRRRFLELLVLGGCAFILSKALFSFLLPPYMREAALLGGDMTVGSPEWRLILTVSYLVIVMVLLPWYRETIFVLRRNWSLVALVLFALLSSLWAEMPDLVLRKSIGLFGATLWGIALAVRFSFQDHLRILSWIFRIIAVLSLACIVLLPSYGISKDGVWRGIFEYKNALGSMMGLSVLVEWQLPADSRISKIVKSLALLLSAVLLLFSDSITPTVVLIVALPLIEIYKFAALRLRIPLYAIFLATSIAVIAGVTLLVANSDSVTSALGRSSNLSGRTEIWSLVLSAIAERPIAGYGYSGFWLGATPESAVINRVMGGLIMYSHNGYLEILLTLGVIGLLLTLAFLGMGMKRALSFSEQRQSGTELWPLAFLLYFILHNLGECSILIQDLEWAICVSCIAGTDPMLLSFNVQQEDELPLVPMEELT
jgi:exopolysaccharide production protein ExoQ